MNDNITKALVFDRKLRQTSIKTYRSTSRKIAKQFNVEFLSKEWLRENTEIVLDYIKLQKHGSKVAIYSSLLVLLSPSRKKGAKPEYTELYEKIMCYSRQKIMRIKKKPKVKPITG